MLELWNDDDDDDADEYMDDEDPIDLGPCCVCGKEDETVRNLGMLSFKDPVPGTGWGCFQCGLPMDGAQVVICDECADKEPRPEFKWIIYDFADKKQRIAYDGFEQVPFDHDMSKHPEEQEL